MGSVTLIKQALVEFGNCSGLKPNFTMCTVFFGSLNEQEQKDILSILPFNKGHFPMRYLGVPLISKRLGLKDCKALIDKIKNKVNHWRNKSLTYAGRLLLISSVLESIQAYWCSVFLLPKEVIKSINIVLKNFLWSHNDMTKGKAKVAWKSVCKPKCKGGLGPKDLYIWNQAILVKQLWNIASKKDSLWVKWVTTVKLKDSSL